MEAVADPISLETYAALDEVDEAYVTELVRGRVVREPRPGRPHGRIQVGLAWRLRAWAQEHGDAEVTAESGYVLSEEPPTLRGPDLAVVLRPEARREHAAGWVHGAPEVAVEILSPTDGSSAVQRKTLDYLEAGARLVWIVDPTAGTVTVFRPDGSATVLRERDTLDGEDVLPGFTVEVREVLRG